ncbi:MAG: PTS sugar transporter subunit IIA [Spirochaetales bacterium]|nr:PTS sugar transporter subunit IIA [Spirochaetales bacterium]
MNIESTIKKDCCHILESTGKTEVLIELMESLHRADIIKDLDALKTDIFYREQLMSTGMSLGIAIPHVRFGGIDQPAIAIGVQPDGVPDYESLDGEPIKIVVMIIVGAEQHKLHIRLLSQLMTKLKDSAFRNKLIEAPDAETLYSLMVEK